MNNEIVSMQDIVNKAVMMSGIGKTALNLSNVWRTVVTKITPLSEKNAEHDEERIPFGERLAFSTRVIDLKNSVLLIEVDHSGWIQYLNLYKKFIINGIKRELPDLNITTFAFRNRGSTVGLSDLYDEDLKRTQKKMNEKSIEQDEKLRNLFPDKNKSEKKDENSESGTLPADLLAKFDSIRKNNEQTDVD